MFKRNKKWKTKIDNCLLQERERKKKLEFVGERDNK